MADENDKKFKTSEIEPAERAGESKKESVLGEIYNSSLNNFQKPIRVGWKILAGSLFLAIIFGFLAGFGGGLAGLILKTINIPFVGPLNLEQYLPKKEITIRTQEKVTVTPDAQVSELAQQLQSQIVKIFPKKVLPKKGAAITEQIYLDSEAAGQGFILTSDGWIISNSDVVGDLKEDYVVMTSGQKAYPIKELVADRFSGIVFLKIQAASLATVKLALPEYLTLGQQVLVFGGHDKLAGAYVSQLKYFPASGKDDLMKSSDKLSEFLRLDRELPAAFNGSPVINLSGEVVGIIKGIRTESAKAPLSQNMDTAVPVNYFKEVIGQVLKLGEIKRPSLGVDYLDLSRAGGITDEQFRDLMKGALVYGAPAKGSPAETAGIKNKDVILKVNNDSINNWYSLTELIQEYSPDSEVELTVLRDDEEEKIKVKLGTLE